MKVKELIEQLKRMPQDSEVVIGYSGIVTVGDNGNKYIDQDNLELVDRLRYYNDWVQIIGQGSYIANPYYYDKEGILTKQQKRQILKMPCPLQEIMNLQTMSKQSFINLAFMVLRKYFENNLISHNFKDLLLMRDLLGTKWAKKYGVTNIK